MVMNKPCGSWRVKKNAHITNWSVVGASVSVHFESCR